MDSLEEKLGGVLEKPEELLLVVKDLIDVVIETLILVLKGMLAWS